MAVLISHPGITLRQFELDDAPAIFNLINRNRGHLSHFGEETADKYPSLSSVEASIKTPKNPSRLRFGIWSDSQGLVGSINLTPDEDNPQRGEIGYYLGEEFTGKGYMLNATLTLTTYAFTHLGYDEIYGQVHPDNLPSQKVLIKAGFTETEAKDGKKTYTLKNTPSQAGLSR